MRESFAPFCKFMLNDIEGGGKVHTVSGDPGGTTCWGFAQKFNTDIDVTKLNEDSAMARALVKYWIPNGCDEAPWPLDVMMFDAAFNQSHALAKGMLGMHIGTAVIARLLRYFDKTNPKLAPLVAWRVPKVLDYIRKAGGQI